ncbi:hypothetical protein ZWY2020_027159 [Hordeum vulgare]|nr:hypothetical protein ZWY2020_027159 [Hordeum vulgare]
MAGWTSCESDDSDKFEWKIYGEAEPSWAPALRNIDAPGPSTLVHEGSNGWANEETSSIYLVKDYVGMGFPKKMVVKGIKEIGHSDGNALLELLLTYKALEDGDDLDSENSYGDDNVGDTEPDSSGSTFLRDMSEKDEKIKSLVDMGFSEYEANMAIKRCGVDLDLCELVDSISASQIAEDIHSRNLSDHQATDRCFNSFGGRKKARLMEETELEEER